MVGIDFGTFPVGMIDMNLGLLGFTDYYSANLYTSIKNKYPLGKTTGLEFLKTGCIDLDKYINDISKDINQYQIEDLEGVRPPSYYGHDYTKWNITQLESYKNSENERLKKSRTLLNLLKPYKKQLELAFINQDCRNQIETVRQEETAQVFTDTSAKAETRVLTDTKNKQYLLIGVGAVAVLTVVYLVVRKK